MSASEAPRASAPDNAITLWSEYAAWAGKAHHVLHKPRWWHPLSSGPSSAWKQPSPFAVLRNRQIAVLRSWSSEFYPRTIAVRIQDRAKLGLDLSPPGAALAGSLPGPKRPWQEPWAPSSAGISVLHWSQPAQLKARIADRKCLQVPHPLDRGKCSQE